MRLILSKTWLLDKLSIVIVVNDNIHINVCLFDIATIESIIFLNVKARCVCNPLILIEVKNLGAYFLTKTYNKFVYQKI